MATQQTNHAPKTGKQITTIDGRLVDSDSEAWRLCCEAVYVLKLPKDNRKAFFEAITKKRGESGVKYLQAEIDRVEPSFILALGSKEQRRAYLDGVERERGWSTRRSLEAKVIETWEKRNAASVA